MGSQGKRMFWWTHSPVSVASGKQAASRLCKSWAPDRDKCKARDRLSWGLHFPQYWWCSSTCFWLERPRDHPNWMRHIPWLVPVSFRDVLFTFLLVLLLPLNLQELFLKGFAVPSSCCRDDVAEQVEVVWPIRDRAETTNKRLAWQWLGERLLNLPCARSTAVFSTAGLWNC